jgi:amino acid adenylation domain-containing protein
LTANDRLAAVTTLSFDIAGLELFLPLLAGARIILVPTEVASDAQRLSDLLTHEHATVLQATPATWRMLLEGGWRPSPSLRMLCGGEALSRELAARLLQAGATLWNLYGPTETTIWSAQKRVIEASDADSIGGPIANTRLYVLDGRGEPVAIGIPGELYIGGLGVARCYWRRADLTAERFVPDPFSTEAGARLYRTGDLVRWRDDATLQFLGRLDHQVKIRGFRIELGEIESALRAIPEVAEAVVLAREEEPAHKQLVAYLTLKTTNTHNPQDATMSVPQLRDRLLATLPAYMIPSAFVVLDTLPLTPNAKIDRKALPKPDSLDHTQHSTLLPPRTPIEEALHDIFAEVLRVPQVALNIGFFELGGHSLLATQVIARIRSTFTLELPLRTLFEAPTVATLAQRVSEALGSAAGVSAPPLLRASREGSLPLSFAQQRLWFLDQLEPGSSVYHLPLALRLSGPLNVEALESSLHEIVVRHEALRTVFPLQQGVPSQQITEPHFTLQRARLQELASASSASGTLEVEAVEADTVAGLVGSWVSEQTRTPFDLQHGPLFRASLLHLSEGDHVLVLTLHHIVSDGWSIGVLTRELSALYSAYCAGEASPLEPLPLQYADYALWQRGWLQGSVLEDQLGYWKSRLSGAPALLELPTDRPRPAVQTYRGAIVRVELSSELTAGLHLLCRETGTTLFMALLGALNVLLCRYSGQHDIVVGTPIAGRTRSELEGLIGFFVNTLAMRTDLSGDPSFVALLGRIREEALGAYAHQEVPFEKLVEELSPQRSMSHAPLFQVALVVQNTPQGRPSLQGLELDILPVESRTTKFDLTFLATVKDAKLRLSLEYNTDLFDGDRMERMLQHLHTLLNAIAYHPQHSIATLPLLTPQETNTLLHHFNTAANIPTPKLPIHSQFQRVVEHNPNAIAIRTRHHHLSYQQLNAYANHIAHQLIQHNINNHHVVAIIANPSIQRIAALLAILKAGAAYLPLDPNNPTQRQQAILNDAKPSLLIADANQAQTLKDLPVPHYLLQPFDPNHTYHDPGNLPNNTHPDDLAYLLFTSGSTGVPKGVGVPHRAVMRLVSQPNFCQLGPQEVVLHLAPLAFDASTFEIWAPLLNGGSLALFEGEQPDLQELASCIQHHRVSTLWLTAGLFHAMVEGAIWGLRGVRQLLAGGDVLSPSHVGRVLAEVAGCTLINGYGPTENTTFSSCYRVGPDWDGVGSVPIGRGINGTRLYVVDARGQLVGIGVAGELYGPGAEPRGSAPARVVGWRRVTSSVRI